MVRTKMTHSDKPGLREALEFESSRLTTNEYEISKKQRLWYEGVENKELRLAYAISLSQSTRVDDIRESLLHFRDFMNDVEASGCRIEDLLWLMATSHYYLCQFDKARESVEQLYRLQPDSPQVHSLFQAIKYRHNEQMEQAKKIETDNLVTAGVGVGVLSLLIGGAFMLARGRK